MKTFESKASIEKLNLEKVIQLIAPTNPKVIVEIGTHMGGSADVFWRYFKPDILITIDSGPIPAGTIITDKVQYLWNSKSQDMETYDKVLTLLKGRKVDFLFIDGGHLLSEVTEDYSIYSELVAPGAWIGFDDILFPVDGLRESPYFWEKVKEGKNYIEIHDGPSSMGVGLLKK